MKKLVLVLAVVLGLVGFIGLKTAEAAFVDILWKRGFSVGTIANPQMYQSTVFTSGDQVGGSLPPAKGGDIVLLDITDRTETQLDWLGAFIQDNPNLGPRYALRFTSSTAWMKDQLYKRGFITTTWSQIRGVFWDRELKQRLGNVDSLYSHPGWRPWDDCWANCDYEACLEVGVFPEDACDCEQHEGRWFCHKKNIFNYSDFLDH